jgi:hypothetical protein
MMSNEQLRRLLQSALPPPAPAAHPRNAWPMIAARLDSRPAWTMFDLALAGGIVIALLMVPQALFVLAWHL